MRIISILSQKGGAGKTTLALNLAVAASIDGQKTLVLDIDNQASASAWYDNREREWPKVQPIPSARLQKTIDENKKEIDLFIIDTPARTEGDSLIATRLCDLVLIPCRPGFLDLMAIQQSLSLTDLAKKKSIIVLNAIPSGGSLPEEATEAIKSYGKILCPIHIKQRVAFMHAMTEGLGVLEYEPNGKAAFEINGIYKFLKKELKK